MKYDFSKCNNLQFKAKNEEGLITGYLKVPNGGKVYVYTDSVGNDYDAGLQFDIKDWESCFNSEDFIKWAERRELEIIPRDPETYTDWKVGDRVILKEAGAISGDIDYNIAVKLGDIVFLLNDRGIVVTSSTAMLTKCYTLVLTDYEQELIHAQELEEKKKKCPFKEGDKVLVRDSDTSWKFDIFQNYEENACYSYECLGSEYEQCIPLNEHTWKLLGTTDEYKEEE